MLKNILTNTPKPIYGRIFSVLILLALWSIFWLAPWQTWLTAILWARFAIGLVLFLVPGMCLTKLIHPAPAKSLTYYFSVGFAVSIALTGTFGLLARIFQLSILFVYIGLYLSGIFFISILVWRAKFFSRKRWRRPDFWFIVACLITLIAIVIAVNIATPPTAYGDDFTYNAQLNYFQNAPRYTFEYDDVLNRMEIARFWLAFWPLVEAILAELSGIHGLLVTGIYIAPALVVLSAASIYSLGRTLNFSPQISLLAVTAQIVCLLRLTTENLVGKIFFDRLPEDKVVAAFVLSLVTIQLVVYFLDKSSSQRLTLLAIAALGLMFTHPVILGMTALICGFYGLITLAVHRNFKSFSQMVVVLTLITLAPFSLRFSEGEKLFAFSITESQDAGWNEILKSQRLQILENKRFYGISPSLITGFPYELGLVAGILGLLYIKQNKAARYIVASLISLGLFTLPYTGWIFGLALTPNQLWRLTWLMPFGISIAFLAQTGLIILLDRLLWFPKYDQGFRNLLIIGMQLALLTGAFYLIPWAKGNLGFGPMKPGSVRWYHEYIEIGDAIHDYVPPNAIIVGGPNRTTNDLIPSLSLNVRLVSFRNERGGRTAVLWEAMMGDATALDERLALFEEHSVAYLVIREDIDWMDELLESYPDRFDIIHQNRKLILYQILP